MLILHSHFDDRILIVTADIGDGFTNEDLFYAANRVDEPEAQMQWMDHAWQRLVRMGIDILELPSMSVNDAYVLTSRNNTVIAAERCASFGWDPLPDHTTNDLIARAERELELTRVGEETAS